MFRRIAVVWRRIRAALSDNPPPPAHYRTAAMSFAMDCPLATVGEWVDFCTRVQGNAFDEGYFRGISDGLMGPSSPMLPIDSTDYLLQLDQTRVVELQGNKDEGEPWN